MRLPRLKIPSSQGVAIYHCISRVVDRQFLFGAAEKNYFLSLLRKHARFCHVEVLTYCMMSNHFHLLVAVGKRPDTLPTDEVLFAHLQHSGVAVQRISDLKQKLERWTLEGASAQAQALRESYWNRCWDLSFFMKGLKQEFTQWYNRLHGRRGTLWEERFKSMLVEGNGQALLTLAAYIDLNPVRAGIAGEPGDYRWCGYGEAMTGGPQARKGIEQLMGPTDALTHYRHLLYSGALEEGLKEDGSPMRKCIPPERIQEVLDRKSKLTPSEMLHCRVRYFCDGTALGSREFVDNVFANARHRFGPARKTGARAMKYLNAPQIYSLRDLRLNVIG